jgi:hypothetical protein
MSEWEWSISENHTDKEKRKCLEGNLSQYECTQLKCHDDTVTGTTTVANIVGFNAVCDRVTGVTHAASCFVCQWTDLEKIWQAHICVQSC